MRKPSRNQIVIICSKHENHAKPGEEILPQKQKVAIVRFDPEVATT